MRAFGRLLACLVILASLIAASPASAADEVAPLPDDFLWGVSSSGFQSEGSNPDSNWLRYSETKEHVGNAVDFRHRYAEDIALAADMGVEVYRFGMPGAPLSQYLHMSRYAVRHFAPDVLVFVVVHNDFFDSVRELREDPGFLQLGRRDGGFVEVAPTGPREGPPAWRWSATMRYLRLTLQSYVLVGTPAADERRYIANVPVDEVREG